MNLSPWTVFLIIITNLTAILFIYLFIKLYYNNSSRHLKTSISSNNDINITKAPPVCPFMAAFNRAKKLELEKKSETNALSDSKNQLKDKNVESKHIKRSIPKIPEENKSLNVVNLDKISPEVKSGNVTELQMVSENISLDVKSDFTNKATKPIKVSQNLKKATSPDEIKSFYEHIPSHVKQLEQEKLMMTLKPEEREEEVKIRHNQLQQIYKIMGEKSELFGISSFEDIHDQMKLYVQS